MLLGEKTEKLQGKPLSSVIAQSDLLARLRKGETRILCQATHADGSTFSVSVSGGSKQGAQTVDLLVRGIYEEPGNSIESLRRMEATVGEDGLADAQEKPLESSIKHTQAPGKKAKKKGVNFAEDVVQEDGPASKAAEVEAPKAKAKEAEVAAPKHKEVEEKRERDPEAGSQAASTDGYAGPGAGMQAQLKRAKRFKHLRRLLDMSDASMFARTVRQRIPLFVLLAIALHAVLFGVYTSLVLASR